MKNSKRLTAILLAILMVCSMAFTVMAAGSNTIEVTGAQANETYNLYKLLDLTVDTDDPTDPNTYNGYFYTLNATWADFFKTGGAGNAYVTLTDQGDGVTMVEWKDDKKSETDMIAFAKAAAKYATDNSITVTDTETPVTDGIFEFTGLDDGYYLVTSTNGTRAMALTTPDRPKATIYEKNPDATIDKTVEEDSTTTFGDANTVQIGDTVNYKVIINAKKGAKNYVLHDTMAIGLKFNNDVAIAGLTSPDDYSVVTTGLEGDGCTFEIRFTQTYLDTLVADSTELTVTYSAEVTKDIPLSGATNKAKLTWGSNSETELDTTTTKTHQFKVTKYDGRDGTKTPIKDAEFKLLDASGNLVKLVEVSTSEYRVADDTEAGQDTFKTIDSTKITITGVDLDKYSLVEVKAPAGFNKLKDPVVINVGDILADNSFDLEVANLTGTELPSTGGMGTTVLYIVGGILVAGAAVLLITKKRMGASR